jgi:hypothetical protein
MNAQERTTIVNRKELINRVTENREIHAEFLRESLSGFRSMAKDKLSERKATADSDMWDVVFKSQNHIDKLTDEELIGFSDTVVLTRAIAVDISAPQSHLDEYDTVINMLIWDTRDTIELTLTEFRKYVEDKWNWTDSFRNSVRDSYMASGRAFDGEALADQVRARLREETRQKMFSPEWKASKEKATNQPPVEDAEDAEDDVREGAEPL